jgi:hypothetical protein
VADIVYNQGADTLMEAALNTITLDLRAAYTYGVGTGIDNRDLNFVLDIDNLTNVSISTSRQALTGETSTLDEANDRANVDSGDITFPAHATETPATAMIIYHEGGGTDATRELVACYTSGFPQPVNGGLVVTVTDFLRASTV